MTEMHIVNIGFIPLVDCALLAIAKEVGFARKYDVQLNLHKEVSWANVRDKVYLGYLDGAQMLAGMPLAANMRLMPNSCDMVAPFVLGRNGNAVTVSQALFDEMKAVDEDVLTRLDLKTTGAALKKVIESRKVEGLPALRFGMVFPFSCHNYHLRYWLAACGIDPDVDVHLEVIPPPFMDRCLEEGRIDGFCVGEPWNSIAVAQDVGVIIATTAQIWDRCPEKVLGLRKSWVESNPITLGGLLKALQEAATWVSDVANHKQLAEILSDVAYLDVPAEIIGRALSGEMKMSNGEESVMSPAFLTLSGEDANRPRKAEAQWLFDQMKRWGQNRGVELTDDLCEESYSGKMYADYLSAMVGSAFEGEIKLFDDV